MSARYISYAIQPPLTRTTLALRVPAAARGPLAAWPRGSALSSRYTDWVAPRRFVQMVTPSRVRQGEHGLAYPALELLVVAELLEELRVVLHQREDDAAEGLVVLDPGVLLV